MADAAGRAVSIPLVGGGEEPTLDRFSVEGRRASGFPKLDVPNRDIALPEAAPRPPVLPQVSERDLVAHVNRLAHRNFAVDLGAYPLDSGKLFEVLGEIVGLLDRLMADLGEAARTKPGKVDRGGDGIQRLIGADVR